MNISKDEQRVLHALAQGGHIRHHRDPDTGKISAIDCRTREGWLLACSLDLFRGLKRKHLIASRDGGPYRISRQGRSAVRAQADNR